MMKNRKLVVLILFLWCTVSMRAQYNTNRLLISAEIALDYHDYVVAIQHCNNILSGKPYLYQPWYYRGVAKECLGDYAGAESDFTEAVKLNPYIYQIFNFRAESRMNQDKFQDAITDFDAALKLNPDQKGSWFNRAYARYRSKDVEKAREDLKYVIKRWPSMPNAYSLMTETYLNANDTATASRWLEKTLKVNPYDGNSWSIVGRLNLQRKNWAAAEKAFSSAIHYTPKVVNNYTYRAMTRVNLNKLRQAMDDYDRAISMNGNNFIAHYNRGLLRQTLGDDNRAIEDFNYVLGLEPDNLLALYNRAILLDRTGDYRAAIRDYSRVIEKFPNFWNGLTSRANCYRRLGMTAKAELDEFRVLKRQMDKHVGIQQRWSRSKLRQVRKMSDIDVEKYDQWVVQDNEVTTPEYKNEYRGNVQDRNVEVEYMPMFLLSYMPYKNGINSYQLVDRDVETFNRTIRPTLPVYISCKSNALTQEQSRRYFVAIDSLTTRISDIKNYNQVATLLFQRAVAHASTHNFSEALNDINDYMTMDSVSVLAYWQRGVCQAMMSNYAQSNGNDLKVVLGKSLDDLRRASGMAGEKNAFVIYDIANLHAMQRNYNDAIDTYTQAITLNPSLAEAYFNRGLTYIFSGNKSKGLADLSKAGELGIYDAYSVMKKYASEKH